MANRHFQFGKVSSSQCIVLCVILALLAVYVIMNRDKLFKSSFGAIGKGVRRKVKILFYNGASQGIYLTPITHGRSEKTGLNEFNPKDWPDDVKIKDYGLKATWDGKATKTLNPIVTRIGDFDYVCVHGLPGGAFRMRIWVKGGIKEGDYISYQPGKAIEYQRVEDRQGTILRHIPYGESKQLTGDNHNHIAFDRSRRIKTDRMTSGNPILRDALPTVNVTGIELPKTS